ncbi:putative transporter MCH4 [Spathaspora sp. JA1]|nr:putative transporter MCH4 [Spathaspora sp. JA1]
MINDMKEESMEHDQEVVPSSSISRTVTHDFASSHQIDDPHKFSDGWNTRSMLVLFGSFLGMIGSLGFVNSGGVLQTYLLQNTLQNSSSSTVGWIFSVYNFFAFGMTLISGPIFDKIGCKIPIAFGIIVMMVGLVLTSFCKQVYQFILSYGIVTGLGAAFTFGPFISCLSHYFLEKRALAIGASYTGGGIGGVVLPLIFRSLFEKVGFGWTIRIGALICFFFLTVGWILVHDRHEEFKEHSEESIFKQIVGSVDFKILLHHGLFSVIVFGLLFNGLAFLITLVVISSYSTSRGFTDSESYLLVVVFNCFSIPGRIIPSYLADNHLGRFNTFCIINTVSIIAFTVIWLPFGHHLTALFVFAACFGFSSGSVLSLSASLVASIIPTKEIGKGLGTAFFILSIGDLFAIPIAGAITNAGTRKSYDNLVIFLTCCAGVGLLVSLLARYLYGGLNLKRV